MRLEWSIFAIDDREGIFDFIELDSPRAAVKVDDPLGRQVQRLAEFPQSGRAGRVADTYELVTNGLPYVIAYRISADTVRILRVLHGAQQWPDSMPQ